MQDNKIYNDLKFSYENELFPVMKLHFTVRKRFTDKQYLTFIMIMCTEICIKYLKDADFILNFLYGLIEKGWISFL